MEYNVVCKNIDEYKNKLDKYIKIEFLNDTNCCFANGLLERFKTLCQYISFSCHIFIYRDEKKHFFDSFDLEYIWFIIKNNYTIKYQNSKNVMYLKLLPDKKYDFYYNMFNNKYNDKLECSFDIKFNEQIINDDKKKILGEYKITIVDNIYD
jgi:hypothetical protein